MKKIATTFLAVLLLLQSTQFAVPTVAASSNQSITIVDQNGNDISNEEFAVGGPSRSFTIYRGQTKVGEGSAKGAEVYFNVKTGNTNVEFETNSLGQPTKVLVSYPGTKMPADNIIRIASDPENRQTINIQPREQPTAKPQVKSMPSLAFGFVGKNSMPLASLLPQTLDCRPCIDTQIAYCERVRKVKIAATAFAGGVTFAFGLGATVVGVGAAVCVGAVGGSALLCFQYNEDARVCKQGANTVCRTPESNYTAICPMNEKNLYYARGGY